MVCSRGESLTTHMNQMKLFNAIAATAAVIGTSLITANSSYAKNGWIYVSTDHMNVSSYVKPQQFSGRYREYMYHASNITQPLKMLADCQGWRVQGAVGQVWRDIMPSSTGDTIFKIICR